MSTATSTHPDLPPEEVRQLAEQVVGRIATWTDTSWAHDSSRVWRADGAQTGVWYVKIHQNTRFHYREVDAYRSWVPSLGTTAPTLVTADSALRAVVITAVPGHPLHGLDHPPEQQQLLFRQIGALAAAIHRSAAPLPANEGVPALAKVERHLEAARPYLRPGDEKFIARSWRTPKTFRPWTACRHTGTSSCFIGQASCRDRSCRIGRRPLPPQL